MSRVIPRDWPEYFGRPEVRLDGKLIGHIGDNCMIEFLPRPPVERRGFEITATIVIDKGDLDWLREWSSWPTPARKRAPRRLSKGMRKHVRRKKAEARRAAARGGSW